MSSGYPEFRRKLDAVLRQRDPQALRAFLVGEGQWDAQTTTDPERAMWMMIATSPALASLRDEAIAWLAAHGYAEEARALGRGSGGNPCNPVVRDKVGKSGKRGETSVRRPPTGPDKRPPGNHSSGPPQRTSNHPVKPPRYRS